MINRRKKFCFCVCVLPVTLCCAYLLCVYSVYVRRASRVKDFDFSKHVQSVPWREGEPPLWANYVLKKKQKQHPPKSIFNFDQVYLGGTQTDVDRTEDRKKKKIVTKLKKTLSDLCRRNKDEAACQDLQLLDDKISRNGNDLDPAWLYHSIEIINDTQARKDWNSYADRGITIVGKKISFSK